MGIIGYKPQTLSNLLKSKMVIINPHQNEVLACVGLDNYLGFNFYFSSRKPIVECNYKDVDKKLSRDKLILYASMAWNSCLFSLNIIKKLLWLASFSLP